MLAVGIDVGGTKTSCVVTDSSDALLHTQVATTDTGALTAQIVELARTAIARTARDAVTAIGIAMPGQVEPRRGTAELAVNLGAPDIELGPMVESETGLPCFVEHDARAAGTWVFERQREPGAAESDLCYLSVGTGIAAAIFIDGRVLRGQTGLAGEVGHIVVDPEGRPCPCGSTGCLETVAAGPAIARAARDAAASGRLTRLTTASTARDVFEAAAAGDDSAQEIAAKLGEHFARAVRGLVMTLGIQRIVIGGGVAGGGEAFLQPIKQALADERRKSALVETAFAGTSLELLAPDLEPGARGAAAIARQRLAARQGEGVAAQ
jgi:predicted NBD/HSP70 family sugar kinase